MRKSAMIIINPVAGKEEAVSYGEIIREALKYKYTNLLVKHTKGEGDAKKFASQACEENFDLVVCLGGDGTVNETVNGLAGFEKRPMLGIIPLGTVNNLAGALNIPDEPKKAIELLKSGYYKEIDVGQANDKYFTNSLGIGNLATAVYDVDPEEKTKLGPLAYVKAVGKEILKDDDFSLRLEMDDETWEGEVSVIIITLLDSIGGFKSIISEAEIGDGKMHVFAIKSLDLSKLIAIMPYLVTGSISDSKNIKYFKTENLKVKVLDNNQYKSNIDGDEGPNLPLEMKILPRHLRVISKEKS